MTKKLLIWCLLLFSVIALTACQGDSTSIQTTELQNQYENFSYYKDFTMTDDGVIYVYGLEKTYSFGELFLAQAIQGIFSRTDSKYYYLNSEVSSFAYYLNYIIDNYELERENTSLDSMVEDYKTTFDVNGYILYDVDSNPESVNVASSLAGAFGWLPIDTKMENYALSMGLSLAMDVTDKSEKWCFENYKEYFDNSGLVQQGGGNVALRDYGIASNYFYFYPDSHDTETILFRGAVHAWAQDDAPIFGWGPDDEDTHVGISTANGQFTLASDYSYNLSMFGCVEYYDIESLQQPNHLTDVTATPGYHYITIIRSDGDNVQTWTNSAFNFNSGDLASERGDFPMGWSTQISLIDLAPSILQYTYETADENDFFVAAVSGQGYIYPQNYPDLIEFTQKMGTYLRKTDISVVQILDSSFDQDVIEAYSKIEELTGGIYLSGNKYAGLEGSIYWSENGKPFISCRESLWDADIQAMADRINGYNTDPTSIEGYTMINLHPWSMDYQDVQTLISLLDEHVIVVSPEDFIHLIKDNVPHDNVNLNN